jgi:3-hydroxybutyryl-CoA dehydratase
MKISNIEIGMTESYSQTITDADIKMYAGISGDNNPIHMSDEYAKKSRFKNRIAHGLLSAGFFSALFGTRLPGIGCVYVSQNLEFKRPVFLGDTITAIITVTKVDLKNKKVYFRTFCMVKNKIVIDGQAALFIPEK